MRLGENERPVGDAGFSAVCYRCAVRVLGPLLLGWCAEWVPCPPLRCRAFRVQPGFAGPGGFLLLGRETEWDPPPLRAARGGGLAPALFWTILCVRVRTGPKCVSSFVP